MYEVRCEASAAPLNPNGHALILASNPVVHPPDAAQGHAALGLEAKVLRLCSATKSKPQRIKRAATEQRCSVAVSNYMSYRVSYNV